MKKDKKNIIAVVLVIIVGVSLLGFNNLFLPTPEVQSGGVNREDAMKTKVPCINPSLPIPNEYHIHPELRIVVDGQNVAVPKDIGIGVGGCERAIHTHDTTGQIHIEPNFYQEFTLRDFFGVWGQPFSKDEVLGRRANEEYEIVMAVDGGVSLEFENLVLRDKQNILIEYKKR